MLKAGEAPKDGGEGPRYKCRVGEEGVETEGGKGDRKREPRIRSGNPSQYGTTWLRSVVLQPTTPPPKDFKECVTQHQVP